MIENVIALYVLMRNDLASLNCGKMAAQATHAANQMVFEAKSGDEKLTNLLASWEASTGHGFGTCIVLGVDEVQMRETVDVARDLGLHCGITHDPSYPLMDGKVLHLLPLDTCGWVFGGKLDCAPAVYDLKLMA